MSDPFPINKVATVVDDVIDGVANVAAQLADTAIFSAAPVLALPILDVLTEEAVKLIIQTFYQQFALFVTFEIINIQTDLETNASQKALAILKAAQKSGDPIAIQTALADFQKATVSLTRFDGSANPGSL